MYNLFTFFILKKLLYGTFVIWSTLTYPAIYFNRVIHISFPMMGVLSMFPTLEYAFLDFDIKQLEFLKWYVVHLFFEDLPFHQFGAFLFTCNSKYSSPHKVYPQPKNNRLKIYDIWYPFDSTSLSKLAFLTQPITSIT